MFAVTPPDPSQQADFWNLSWALDGGQHCPVEKPFMVLGALGLWNVKQSKNFLETLFWNKGAFPLWLCSHLDICEHNNARRNKTTEPRSPRRGGLGPFPFEPWSGSFAARTPPALQPGTNSLDMFFLAAGGNRSPVSVVYTVLNLYVLLSLHGTARQSKKKESLELQPLHRWRSVHTDQEHSR